MGASGWDYRVPFAGGVEQAFVLAQQMVLESGDFIWPWDDLDPEFDEGEARGRPQTLDEVAAAKEDEAFWEEGTHTILDLHRVSTTTDDGEFGVIRPMTTSELMEAFGTDRTSRQQFEAVATSNGSGLLDGYSGDRWSGRSLVIHDLEGQPSEVYFWGISGD